MKTATRNFLDEAVKRALRFANQHWSDTAFSFDAMADEACVSRYHFHRVFKAPAQETPGEYVRRIRLDTAAHLVVERTDLSLTKIVYDCGFTSSSLFSRQFKQRFGAAPAAVRRSGKIPQTDPPQNEHVPVGPYPVEVRTETAKSAFCALARGYTSLPITLA